MNSRKSINIFLFLFVAILISILVFDTDESTQKTFDLSDLDESTIQSIEVTRRTGNQLKFKKTNNQWYMTSPYQVRANIFYIESILQITKAKSILQFSISEKDKNKYKLNPPQATLKLNNQLFLFGTNEQLHLNRYILTHNKLFLLPDRYFYLLNITTPGYIDHALIGVKEKITRLKLVDHDIQFKKSKWEIKPESKDTSTDDINQLMSEWNNSQAIEITKLEDVNYIDKKYSIELNLEGKSKPIIFDIRLHEDFYLFIRRDLKLQYKLNQDMANRLLTLPNL